MERIRNLDRYPKVILLILSAMLAGAAVSFAGLLGFVGLIVPHGVRRFCGSESRFLLPTLLKSLNVAQEVGLQQTGSFFALLRWVILLIWSAATAQYVQVASLARRSMIALIALGMLVLLAAPVLMQQLFAFVFGIIAVLIAIAIPRILRNSSNLMLVLSGTIVSAFMCSILGVMKFVAEEDTELSSIVYWQMGSLASIKGRELLTVSPLLIISGVVLILLAWRLNIMSFGEAEAKTLGVNLKLIRGLCIAGASMLTAASVCLSGTISWLGLIIPHLGRLIVGPDNTKLIPAAMVLGAVFLLFIDTLARIMTSMEIPISILTGLIGAPFYAWLLWKQKAKVL